MRNHWYCFNVTISLPWDQEKILITTTVWEEHQYNFKDQLSAFFMQAVNFLIVDIIGWFDSNFAIKCLLKKVNVGHFNDPCKHLIGRKYKKLSEYKIQTNL